MTCTLKKNWVVWRNEMTFFLYINFSNGKNCGTMYFSVCTCSVALHTTLFGNMEDDNNCIFHNWLALISKALNNFSMKMWLIRNREEIF